MPLRATLVGAPPTTPQVDYPVFGSDDLVKYLAASMIAQQDSINVSYWANVDGIGKDGVFDAVSEAAIQNPERVRGRLDVPSDGDGHRCAARLRL